MSRTCPFHIYTRSIETILHSRRSMPCYVPKFSANVIDMPLRDVSSQGSVGSQDGGKTFNFRKITQTNILSSTASGAEKYTELNSEIHFLKCRYGFSTVKRNLLV